jgi:hypothetical protein
LLCVTDNKGDRSLTTARLVAYTAVFSVLFLTFPTEWFLRNKSKSGGLSPPDFDLFSKLKKPTLGKRCRSIEEVSNEVTSVIRRINKEGVQTGIQDFPKCCTAVIKHNGDYIEGL